MTILAKIVLAVISVSLRLFTRSLKLWSFSATEPWSITKIESEYVTAVSRRCAIIRTVVWFFSAASNRFWRTVCWDWWSTYAVGSSSKRILFSCCSHDDAKVRSCIWPAESCEAGLSSEISELDW